MKSLMSAKSLIAWSIAGSDSGGGAGIQADLHTFRIFGLHGCSILTAITAQNTKGIQSLDPVSGEFIEAQWNSLITDLPPNIIKSGMLANAAMSIAGLLESNPMIPYICDPVIQSTSGYDLISKESLIILKEKLLPRATLITPNIPEAQRLTESKDTKPKNLAKALINEGAKAVLVKGGHSKKNFCEDLFMDKTQSISMRSERINTSSTHGTGCNMSAAIAAYHAQGLSLPDSIEKAKNYINRNLQKSPNIGSGNGPLAFYKPCNEEIDKTNIIREVL